MFNILILEFLIAKRYTFTQYKEKFVSVINIFAMVGIALGVATLIIVMSVMNGYEKALFTKLLGFKGHITVTTHDTKVINWADIQTDIKENIDHIIAVMPVVEKQALAMTDNGTSGILLKGMLLDDVDKKIRLSEGYINRDTNCNGLILGVSLQQALHIDYHSKVKIITPQFNQTMRGMMPRMKSYINCGMFDIGMYEYNNGIIFMNLTDIQLLFELNNTVTGIEIMVDDMKNIPAVKIAILQLLRANAYDNENLLVIDWQEANKTLLDGLKVERSVMFLILSLIIIIAAFNIISSLILLVHDKMKEIAILRTIGMQKISIMRIFMICGCLVGVIGTSIGAFIGIIFSLNIEKIRQYLESFSDVKIFDPIVYFLTALPSNIDLTEVLYTILMSLSMSLIATIYPAWRASKASPAEVLKY